MILDYYDRLFTVGMRDTVHDGGCGIGSTLYRRGATDTMMPAGTHARVTCLRCYDVAIARTKRRIARRR